VHVSHEHCSRPHRVFGQEVQKKAVDIVGVRANRPANGVTDLNDTACRQPAEKRHFVVQGHRKPSLALSK
jgi:hypothetical protein